MLHKLHFLMFSVMFVIVTSPLYAAGKEWYTEGDFAPAIRIEFRLVNTLNLDRANYPVVIKRSELPLQNLHEMWVTVVDPALPSSPEPSKEVLAKFGGHQMRAETNGHQIFHQLDDLDRDGIWDELCFETDIKARETRTMYLYIGFSQRGWNAHGTHAAIGSYCHHLIPFWESANIGWKLWYATDCDMFGKRKSVLMSNELYMKNLDGYNVPYDYGSDIMRVADTFGAGGICLFEVPAQPDSVSRPRFAPVRGDKFSPDGWNEGQFNDTRYAFEVVVNGPVRSMVRVKTMNWNTGGGTYELEQNYTVYTNQNYATCLVKYAKFLPEEPLTMFGCGIRKNQGEFDSYQKGNIVITGGDDEISDPDDTEGLRKVHVDYVGTALVVKDKYKPEYRFVKARGGNHTFAVPVTGDLTYEYMIFGAWSEGSVLKTPEEFRAYVLKTAQEYNNPVTVTVAGVERKAQ
ncbi:DUF4861 domain-containing protein [bacterium]|nr:DUF4861 domain-containing protein [bacterium]